MNWGRWNEENLKNQQLVLGDFRTQIAVHGCAIQVWKQRQVIDVHSVQVLQTIGPIFVGYANFDEHMRANIWIQMILDPIPQRLLKGKSCEQTALIY